MGTTGIDPTRQTIIAALRKGPVSVADYRACLCNSKHALAQSIHRMRNDGWVVRCVNAHFSQPPAYYELVREPTP